MWPGQAVRAAIGDEIDVWLDNESNLLRWQGTMSVSERRVLMTQWIGRAWEKVKKENQSLLWRSFEKTGLLMRADKKDEDRICPEGLTKPYSFHGAENPRPILYASRTMRDPWKDGMEREVTVILKVDPVTNEVQKLGLELKEFEGLDKVYVSGVTEGEAGAISGLATSTTVLSVWMIVCLSKA